MVGRSYPCITYMRLRDAERRASALASSSQTVDEGLLVSQQGYEIAGRFGDPEFAPPFSGWLEPRLAWRMACDEAERIALECGGCTLAILHANSIGIGDQFLPSSDFKLKGVDIRVCGYTLRGHAVSTSLRSANLRYERFKAVVRKRGAHLAPTPILSDAKPGLKFQPDHRLKVINVFFQNPTTSTMRLTWQSYARELATGEGWPDPPEWTAIEIPPRSALYLDSLFQGEANVEAVWWRFRTGTGESRWTGNVLLAPRSLTDDAPGIAWYAYTPQPLGPSDFHWSQLPCLQTERLVIRNWEDGDEARYAEVCNTPAVMGFLGGVQSPGEVADDVTYFRSLGESGPTYWVVERLEDGEFLGFCGALRVEEEGSPVEGELEIGWRFRADEWHRGYAYEAAAAVLKCVFEELGEPDLVARIDSRNHASSRLAEKLGMRRNESRSHPTGDDGQVLDVYEMDRRGYWESGLTSAILG